MSLKPGDRVLFDLVGDFSGPYKGSIVVANDKMTIVKPDNDLPVRSQIYNIRKTG